MKTRTAVLALAVAAMGLTGCSYSTQPDQVALAFNDGPFSPRTFDKCIPVSKREGQGPNDVAFAYPANQRVFDFTGRDGADSSPFRTVSADGIEFEAVPGTLQFVLETECETLLEFHNKIGNRYKAYFDGNDSEGWNSQVLPLYIAQPLETAIDRAAQAYKWRDLYNNPQIKAQWEKDVLAALPDLVNRTTEGDKVFFKNYNLTLQIPTPPQALRDAITGEQTSVAQANAATAKATADKVAAEAQVAVAEANARAEQARIAGQGGAEEAGKRAAIEKGLNPYQPTYVVSGTAPAN